MQNFLAACGQRVYSEIFETFQRKIMKYRVCILVNYFEFSKIVHLKHLCINLDFPIFYQVFGLSLSQYYDLLDK